MKTSYIPLLKKIFIFLSIITIIILFCSSLYFTLNMDEEFTMGIIQHTYNNIISIDNLDVHPPLYYLLLKLFIYIFTFWTHSMFVKIIFARIFSIIIGIIGFYYLHKIILNLGININWKFQILFYAFIPSILFYFTIIRMYELATLFIIIELYELLLSYKNNGQLLNLTLAIIFASLASYTHYFAAVTSGLFFLTFFLTSIIYKRKNMIIKYFISGCSMLILFLPLVPFVMTQFKYETSSLINYNELFYSPFESLIGVVSSDGVFRKLFILILIIISIYIIYWSFNNLNYVFNIFFLNVLTNFILTMSFAFIMVFFKGTPFTPRYTYPIFSIYSFFIISIACLIIFGFHKINISFIGKILLSLAVILLFANSVKSIKNNINYFAKPSVELFHNMNNWKLSSNKNIDVNLNNYPTKFGEPLYVTQSAIYLNSINKNAIIKTNNIKKIRINLLAHDNKVLFDRLFTNIKFQNKS